MSAADAAADAAASADEEENYPLNRFDDEENAYSSATDYETDPEHYDSNAEEPDEPDCQQEQQQTKQASYLVPKHLTM